MTNGTAAKQKKAIEEKQVIRNYEITDIHHAVCQYILYAVNTLDISLNLHLFGLQSTAVSSIHN